MTNVNKAALLEWVEELETTDKPQAKKALHVVGEGFCCLGVACELFKDRLGLRTSAEGVDETKITVRYYTEDSYGSRTLLPKRLASYLGMEGHNTIMVTVDGQRQGVDYLNDSLGMSFKEIAALVRKEYDL